MKQHFGKPGGQEGFILPTILVIAFVIAILALTLMTMNNNEMRSSVRGQARELDASTGDAAMQRSLDSLLTGGNWDNPAAITSFNCLTCSTFTEIPGVIYSIKILPGDRSNTPGAVDSGEDLWPNQGDLSLDRTIFVNVSNTATKKLDRYFSVVHRDTPPYIPGGSGIYAAGCISLGSTWSGNAFDSCAGSPTTTQNSSDCQGNVTAPCITGGNFCLTPQVVPTATISVPPPAVIPAGTTYTVSAVSANTVTLATAPSSVNLSSQVLRVTTSGGTRSYLTVTSVNQASRTITFTTAPASTASSVTSGVPIPVPGNTDITGDWTGQNLGPAPAGWGSITYQCANISLGTGTYTVDGSGGPVILYVTGTISCSGKPKIVTVTGAGQSCCLASLFTIYVVAYPDVNGKLVGGAIALNGNTSGDAFIYAPYSNVNLSGGGSGEWEGAIVAASMSVSGGGSAWFHYDKCLANLGGVNRYAHPPVITKRGWMYRY